MSDDVWDDSADVRPAKARRGNPEMLIQRAVIAYVKKCVVGGMAFAIPNETQGSRNTRAHLLARKANGVVSGVPDVYAFWPGGNCWLEIKAAKGVVSPTQEAIQGILRECGQHVAVVRSIDQAEDALRIAGATLRLSKLRAPVPVQPLRRSAA